MNCSSTEALFERFLEGQLPLVQRGGFLTHLERCAECRSVLEELRVVDALLMTPRQVDLAPNFTFAIMAETRALPAPAPYNPPVQAYLVAYLAAAWLMAGAAFLLAPQLMHALTDTTLDIARSISGAIAAVGAVIGREFARGGSVLTVALGALLVLDLLLVAGFGLVLKYVRPRLVARLRS